MTPMISLDIFLEQVSVLTQFGQNPIPADFVLEWMNHNRELYYKNADNHSCSYKQRTFPCFCCDRKSDCLFNDIYLELSMIEECDKHNNKCKLLIQEYHTLENEKSVIENWLRNHLEFGLNKLGEFTGEINFTISRMGFINGKNKISNAFDYITLFINLDKFKYAFEYKKLFDELFFIRKMIPGELSDYLYKIGKLNLI